MWGAHTSSFPRGRIIQEPEVLEILRGPAWEPLSEGRHSRACPQGAPAWREAGLSGMTPLP